ncbi:hypothetical protein AKJ55_01970, partial [candidate division MSBL1 archaeon SCGC-AAA382M17]
MLLFLVIPLIMSSCIQKKQQREVKQYTIEQFMDNISIFGSSFSSEEEKVLFTSNESGIYNAYEVSVEGGDPKQLTKREETTRALSYFPNDKRIILMSDKGGNELYHIYVRQENGNIKDITPYEKARSSFLGWAHDRESFFFASNKRDPRYMDYYEVPLRTMEAKRIYKNTEGYNLGAISNDTKWLAFSKTITSTNNNMYLYNRESKEMKLLSKHEGEATYYPVDFTADNKFLYYRTDKNSEFDYLSKMNLETGASEKIYEADWDVMYVSHSYNKKYRVIGINRDAQTVVKVFNMETGKEVNFPDFENKNVTSVNISESEDLMAFYVSGSKSPGNLYVYNFNTGDYNKLTNTLNPDINTKDLVEEEVVHYESFDGMEIPA